MRRQTVALETPAEIVSNKVYFRGWNFQPRDMLDFAAVVERCGENYVLAALAKCGAARCKTALETVEKATAVGVAAINAQLMARDATRHLVGEAQDISRQLLRCALEQE